MINKNIEAFEALEEVQQAALLISAKTRHFLDGSPGGNAKEAVLLYAHKMAENPQIVERITNAYIAKQARNKDPLAVLGSFGF